MGMDVYGRKPKSDEGRYFRRNVWGWRPLWELVEAIAPELASRVASPHTNDGTGLGARDSAALAKKLNAACDNGLAAKFATQRREQVCALPDETCQFCRGTGYRQEPPATGEPCKACGAKGKTRAWASHYDAGAEDVREFAQFLAASGGFRIR